MKMLTDLDMQGNAIYNADIDGAVEYVTTSNTYAEVKALYDAGKKIVLDYTDAVSSVSVTYHIYLPLIGSDDEGMLYFAGVGEMEVESGELEYAEMGIVLTSSGWGDPGFVVVQPGLEFITEPSSSNKVATAADLPTVPTALSQLTDDSTHRLVTDIEKVAWNDKISYDGFYEVCLGIPDINNKVITANYLGMVLDRKDPTDTLTFTNVKPNTCMLVVPVLGVTGQITVTLNAGSEFRAEEWSLIFKAGSGMSLNVSAPGYTIVWKDGIPSFQEGKIYEISFLCLYFRYIIAYVSETDLS